MITLGDLSTAHVCYTVYANFDGNGTKVWYVGVSHLRDLHTLPGLATNSEWRNTIRPNDAFELNVAVHPTREAAEAEQTAWLKEVEAEPMGSYFNKNGEQLAPTTRGPVTRRSIRCVDDGAVYDNAAQLADALDVTGAAVSLHLSGKSQTLKGRKYERVV